MKNNTYFYRVMSSREHYPKHKPVSALSPYGFFYVPMQLPQVNNALGHEVGQLSKLFYFKGTK